MIMMQELRSSLHLCEKRRATQSIEGYGSIGLLFEVGDRACSPLCTCESQLHALSTNTTQKYKQPDNVIEYHHLTRSNLTRSNLTLKKKEIPLLLLEYGVVPQNSLITLILTFK